MPAEALGAVRKRIERGWSQEADARDGSGKAVAMVGESAEAWSVLGAFALAATDGIPINHIHGALRALADVTQANSLKEWNDAPLRTQQDVLDALDAAIARIEGDPQ
jgi:hypothetical protein